MSWSAILTNNTDYPRGIEFTTLSELGEFIREYYTREAGDLYYESWKVTGEYPDDLYDLLSPNETGGWERNK